MRNALVISITSIIALIVLVGGYTRLSMSHGDVSSFVTFLATILTIGIPAYIGMIKSGQAHAKSVEVGDKVDEVQAGVTDAKAVAEAAASAATQAESNTNGKLTEQFDSLRALVNEVKQQMTEHLQEHHSEAGN